MPGRHTPSIRSAFGHELAVYQYRESPDKSERTSIHPFPSQKLTLRLVEPSPLDILFHHLTTYSATPLVPYLLAFLRRIYLFNDIHPSCLLDCSISDTKSRPCISQLGGITA
jgi:hypothetical protein